MWETVKIGDFKMDQVILDLVSDSNVLLKKTWECMGEPKLQWSPIQLHMANQRKIIRMGCLHGVIVDIEGSRVVAELKVIEIINDSNPYLELLRIDCAFYMNVIINLKKRSMIIEKNEL